MSTLSVFEMLNLRYEFEELVRGFKFVPKDGTIDNIKLFIESGHRGNRFRDGYDRALEIANVIVENHEKNNLSSVCGKEIEAV